MATVINARNIRISREYGRAGSNAFANAPYHGNCGVAIISPMPVSLARLYESVTNSAKPPFIQSQQQ